MVALLAFELCLREALLRFTSQFHFIAATAILILNPSVLVLYGVDDGSSLLARHPFLSRRFRTHLPPTQYQFGDAPPVAEQICFRDLKTRFFFFSLFFSVLRLPSFSFFLLFAFFPFLLFTSALFTLPFFDLLSSSSPPSFLPLFLFLPLLLFSSCPSSS